jgi:hypothetical protein
LPNRFILLIASTVGNQLQPPEGIVDTLEDLRIPPPFETPLEGIRVEIRVLEPGCRSVQTVNIEQGFTQ